MDNRARITLPDVMFVVFSIAILGALYPVFMDGLQANIGEFSTGEAYIYQLFLPVAVLMLFVAIYRKAARGAR